MTPGAVAKLFIGAADAAAGASCGGPDAHHSPADDRRPAPLRSSTRRAAGHPCRRARQCEGPGGQRGGTRFCAGQTSGWHIHHGYEIAYVLSGALNVQIAGGPIRHVVKGETFEVERDVPHRATNDGSEQAALLITYLKDKKGPWKIPVSPPAVH